MLSRIILPSINRKNFSFPRFSHKRARFERGGRKKYLPLTTRTSIMTEDNGKIHEVGLVVRKKREIDDIIFNNDSTYNDNSKILKNSKKQIRNDTKYVTAIFFSNYGNIFDDIEGNEKIQNYQDFTKSSKNPCTSIENITNVDINCRVALEALGEIIKLENNDFSYVSEEITDKRNFEAEKSLIRARKGREKVFHQLIEIIVKTRENDIIIKAIDELGKDRVSLTKNIYKDRLYDEALIRATNGNFEIRQLIVLMNILSSHDDHNCYRDDIFDALWYGIKIRDFEINEKNLVSLFRLLPLFRVSRKIIRQTLKKKLFSNWWKLGGTEISSIFRTLKDVPDDDVDEETRDISRCASKWMRLHVNTASERELLDIMKILDKMKFLEKQSLEISLLRYMRERGMSTREPALIARIMNYCGKNRIKNEKIFEICENYLTTEFINIPAKNLAEIFVPFGYLNFRAYNSLNFLKNFQNSLETKFNELSANDALKIVLALIYLNQTPHNLVERLFTKDFFVKLHSMNEDVKTIKRMTENFWLIDRAMAFECENYVCRMIPEMLNYERKIFMRSRIKRVTDIIFRTLSKIIGDNDRLSRSVMLGNELSTIDLYIVDILVHSRSTSIGMFEMTKNYDDRKIAILINLPEHYCRNSDCLIGPQMMRIRHMEKLGLRVVTLNYKKLLELRNFPREMSDYLNVRLRISEDI